jgi:hypothetical protein
MIVAEVDPIGRITRSGFLVEVLDLARSSRKSLRVYLGHECTREDKPVSQANSSDLMTTGTTPGGAINAPTST